MITSSLFFVVGNIETMFARGVDECGIEDNAVFGAPKTT